MSSLPLLLVLGSMLWYVEANSGTWATLPMTVAPYLQVGDLRPSTVPVLFGTPPQQINLTVDVATGVLAAYGTDCILCAGTTLFDPSLSSTFKTNNTVQGTPASSGVVASDAVSFEGLLNVQNQHFVNILDGSNLTLEIFIWNGFLGLFLNPLNDTAIAQHFLTNLYESSSLLNPVVGMRFDHANPKITIGALDPNDYEGTINWVPLNPSPDPQGDYRNTFSFDGVKGYDGQFVPYGPNLTAAIDSSSLSISVPNAMTYFNNTNSTGPIQGTIDIVEPDDIFQYDCSNATQKPPETPYVAFTVTINGVDYPIDSTGNLLRPYGPDSAANGTYCPVGIMNKTGNTQPSVALGLPFMRSVYVAYRFPTSNCPGYYGFAFPSGANRTQSQISQKPNATPTNSAQCLSLAAPTSTPTAKVVLLPEYKASKGTYQVYGNQTATPVPLVGVDELLQSVWNDSAFAS